MQRRVLLDENLPHSLRKVLADQEAQTASYAGFAGLKNGKLLDAADKAGFDVLLTGDRTLHLEQNIAQRRIGVVTLSAVSWPILEPHLTKIVAAVELVQPGAVLQVDCGTFRRSR